MKERQAMKANTVKLVYKDHARDQPNVLLIHRWSLYEGLIAWKVYTMGPVNCGLYYAGSLYIQVVFRAGFTV